MSSSPSNPPKRNWMLILTVVGIIITAGGVVATLITVPEFRCRLLGLSCPVEFKQVELVTQTETGEALGGVEVTARGLKGPPVKAYTDDNGYVSINIESKGAVGVTLGKSGYPVQNATINAENPQNTSIVFRFSSSGQPNVDVVGTVPSPTSSPTPTGITTPPPPSPPLAVDENDFIKMELIGADKTENGDVNLSFVITNKTKEDLYLGLRYGDGTITNDLGNACTGRNLQGLASVGDNSKKPNDFTVISPDSPFTVASGCNFSTGTEFSASFPLVRYQPSTSTTDSEGQKTRFSMGFRGIKLDQSTTTNP